MSDENNRARQLHPGTRTNYAVHGVLGTRIGNYIIRKELGRGGMGVVYMAEHPSLGVRVAVKVLLPEVRQHPEQLARFQHEAHAIAALGHEHIVRVLDFGELPDSTPYMIMEWLDGRTLSSELQTKGPFSHARAAHVARGIALALDAAHRNHIIHRDLKPDNIVLVQQGEDRDFVKVLDFGVAKVTGALAGEFRTSVGTILGTPFYMAPEQLLTGAVDPRTDEYALAVMLYEITTGTRPFSAETMQQLLARILNETPPPPQQIAPALPLHASLAIMRGLEKDPAKRFPSILALAEEFGGVPAHSLSSTPATQNLPASTKFAATSAPLSLEAPLNATITSHSVRSPTAAEPTTTAVKPHRDVLLVLGGVVLALVVAMAVGVSTRAASPPRTETALQQNVGVPNAQQTVHIGSNVMIGNVAVTSTSPANRAPEVEVARVMNAGISRFERTEVRNCEAEDFYRYLVLRHSSANNFALETATGAIFGTGTLLPSNLFVCSASDGTVRYSCSGPLTSEGIELHCATPGSTTVCIATYRLLRND